MKTGRVGNDSPRCVKLTLRIVTPDARGFDILPGSASSNWSNEGLRHCAINHARSIGWSFAVAVTDCTEPAICFPTADSPRTVHLGASLSG